MSMKRFPAKLDYKRNPQLSKKTVLRILDWVRSQPHLPDLEEEDAILFLASCLFDEEFAKKTIDLHYTFRTLHPELFGNRDALDAQSNFTHICGITTALPGLSHDGYKVLYSKNVLKSADLTHFNHITETKFFLCMHELMLHEEGALPGWRVIYDMEDMNLGIALKIRPSLITNLMHYFQEASPMQLIALHIVHPKPYVTYLTNLLRPLMKKSLSDVVNVHSNLEEIYRYVPRKNLPLECGGDMPSVEETSVSVKQKIIDNRDILIHNQNLRVQEKLRPRDETKIGFWKYIWD